MAGLRLKDIGIRRAGVVGVGDFVLEIEVATQHGDFKFTGFFNDFGGFLTAVKEAGVFFAARMGRLTDKDVNKNLLTRPIVRNPDGSVQ